jgi:LuxR family transcriptional regulator, maltose regulon positive regulatory protein
MTVVSAPAGSGKTVLLRSWIDQAGLAERAAWVAVGRDERDPQRWWLSVLGALRRTPTGSALIRDLTAGGGGLEQRSDRRQQGSTPEQPHDYSPLI